MVKIVRKDFAYVISFLLVVVVMVCSLWLNPPFRSKLLPFSFSVLPWYSYIGLFFKKKTIKIWIVIVLAHIPLLFMCLVTAALHDSIMSGILNYVDVISFGLLGHM